MCARARRDVNGRLAGIYTEKARAAKAARLVQGRRSDARAIAEGRIYIYLYMYDALSSNHPTLARRLIVLLKYCRD